MAIEAATIRPVEKPWGVSDLLPWRTDSRVGPLIGELCFERRSERSAKSALLLKVLLTSKALSVQVHPDDDFARSIGLPQGKTEAWYILTAVAGAEVAVGLNARLSRAELRAAIVDGSIARLLVWKSVTADDVIHIPAGTIHAIGAGISLVEIQQNSDITFRILDLEHGRPLDVEHAAAAARAEPAEFQLQPERISSERLLLVSVAHFVFERVELPSNSAWSMRADQETWVYCLSGTATAGPHDLTQGIAVFADATEVAIRVGANGVVCLVAYPGGQGPRAQLLSPQWCEAGQAAVPHSVRYPGLRKDSQQ